MSKTPKLVWLGMASTQRQLNEQWPVAMHAKNTLDAETWWWLTPTEAIDFEQADDEWWETGHCPDLVLLRAGEEFRSDPRGQWDGLIEEQCKDHGIKVVRMCCRIIGPDPLKSIAEGELTPAPPPV